MRFPTILALSLALALAACRRSSDPAAPLRIGYFPNVTHAQALVGDAEGDFARALGQPVRSRTFNAGPAEMEALLAGELDACWVGNAPAALAYLRTRGQRLRVIAGAVSGGASLVVHSARSAEELRGKRVGTPQLGNSQDVALRIWLRSKGIPVSEGPEGVQVTPLTNADILSLFGRGQLEGAWVPEPWSARLVLEAGGRLLVDERDLWPGGRFPTTVVVASQRAIQERRADLVALLRAHLALTERWKRAPDPFAQSVNAAFGKLTGHLLSPAVLKAAFSDLQPDTDPMPAALATAAEHAQALGFAPPGDVSGLVDRSLLDEAAASR
jgi:NitT/TauT family transport system substrate-binding protein